jgi:hypothetical protein
MRNPSIPRSDALNRAGTAAQQTGKKSYGPDFGA